MPLLVKGKGAFPSFDGESSFDTESQDEVQDEPYLIAKGFPAFGREACPYLRLRDQARPAVAAARRRRAERESHSKSRSQGRKVGAPHLPSLRA